MVDWHSCHICYPHEIKLLLLLEILGEALHIRIIILIQNRRLVPLVSLVRPTFAGNQL